METAKLSAEEWGDLLDEEKMPVQKHEQKPKAEPCLDDVIRDAVRGLSGYDGYLVGMVIRNVWQARDIGLAYIYLAELLAEKGHDD